MNKRLGITNDEINKIADKLLYTCDSIDYALYHFEYDFDFSDVEDRLLDINVEMCPVCGWWGESHDIIVDEGHNVMCESCSEYKSEVN